MYRKKSTLLWTFTIVVALLLASCGGGNGTPQGTGVVPETGVTETPGGAVMDTPTVDAGGATQMPTTDAGGATQAPTQATDGEQIGGTVSVLAIWGDAELDNFLAMIAPFEEQTGITVEYEGTRDLGAVLNTRVSGGNPPDLAGLPNPGQLVALANQGALLPLDDVLDMDEMRANYDAGFLDLATVDGQTYGIFTKAAVKSLVWYNPKQFEAQGYTVPTTWEELNNLEQQIIDGGGVPWCVGIDGGGGSGWPGTDWVEDIMLRTAGPETYDQWWQHEIPWTDDAVRNAFETWGEIVADQQMVYGGSQNVIATNFGESPFPMFEDPPQCYMHRQASFITTFIQDQFPELVAGEDFDFFVFPPIDDQYGNPLLVAGDLFGMFNDTPQARALMQYLTTAEAQSIWAERGGFLSANKEVDPSIYPDTITQQIGEMITTADAVRFDASDLMPEGVNSAFSQGVLNYVASPDQLDSILQQIESVAQESYTQ